MARHDPPNEFGLSVGLECFFQDKVNKHQSSSLNFNRVIRLHAETTTNGKMKNPPPGDASYPKSATIFAKDPCTILCVHGTSQDGPG